MKHLSGSKKAAFSWALLLALGVFWAWAGSTSHAARRNPSPQPVANSPFKIKFDYSKVDGALFNDIVKEQIEAGARILESFISTEGEITITVVSGDTGNAYAFGAPSEWAENTEEKSIAKTGGIRFGAKYLPEVRDGKSSITALTMHEILHCLGFSGTAKAIAKNLKGGQYSGPHVLKMNNGKPVAFDGAHFAEGTEDVHGIQPRAMNGGGELLSVLDLAVLADMGYEIPEIEQAKGVPHLSFTFPIGYYDVEEDRSGNTTHSVAGLSGNDVLTGHHKDFRYSLVGGGGDDVLISGPLDDTLDGDNFRTKTRDPRGNKPEPGTPGKDTFVIRKNGGKDTIEGFESGKDVIYLSPDVGVTEEQIEKALETFPQEIRKPFRAPDGRSMVMVQKVNLIKVGNFELTVNPNGEKPKASDFRIEEWKP